jgi:hypothetical protein
LSDYLPKRPTEVELNVLKEMFEASVDGQAYDVERFGQYYRPYGVDAPAGTAQSPAAPAPAAPAPTPTPETAPADTVPFETAPAAPAPTAEPKPAPAATEGGKSAEDILAMIRSRQSS